ncbi:MAG: DUF3343 domain-containing protein [Ruminococcaceae bacterium]|nr:DUF3343 domain-containing protein [Oscillospiraceae bacterium]
MNYCFITLRSLTMAQKAETLLRRNGISCTLQRTPRWMEEQGCGNGLRVNCEDIEECVRLLKRNNIPYKRVYLRRENGKMEEMAQ